MSVLGVSGARLYYEVHGSGPLLLMIHGANGTGDVYNGVVELLAEHHTVVTYDRRGFTRSKLIGPQDYAHKLEVDANDARLLIEQLSDRPATIFGSSSGAIVALKVLIDHPSVVRMLFPHEPPAMTLLTEGQKWSNFFVGVYDLFHQFGMEFALNKFRKEMLTESDRQAALHTTINEYTLANFTYWIENELRQYTSADLNPDALKNQADRIMPLVGQESRGYPTYEVSVELARKINKDLIELPGGHNGYITHPSKFAQKLFGALLSTM